QMEDGARAAEKAAVDVRAAAEKLRAKPQSAANDAVIKELDALAPTASAATGGGAGGPGGAGGVGGRGGRGGRAGGAGLPGATAPPEAASAATFASIGPAMVAAAMAMQGSEMPPTKAQLDACQQRQAEFTA